MVSLINDAYLQVSLLAVASTRVTVSGVPPFVPSEVLERELQRFGKMASGFCTVSLGCKDDKLKHIQSLRREAFMVLSTPSLEGIIQIPINQGRSRFRIIMSDGRHTLSSFVLSSQQTSLVEENLLVPHCVCMLKKITNHVLSGGRRAIPLLDVEIIKSAEEVGGKIGDPVQFKPRADQSTPPTLAPRSASVSPSSSYNSLHSSGQSPSRGSVKETPPVFPHQVSPTKVFPISSLNPYLTKWTIKGRVTKKCDIHTWSNSKGEGKLFSLYIVDQSGEIRITAFNNEVDMFFPLVEEGKVYYISKASIKAAKRQFSVLNDYEMTLQANTCIVPCHDSQDVPALHCCFVPIAELESKDTGAVIDVIGVCKSAEEVSSVITKTSREVTKRALHLMDTSGKVVTVTLWGEEAERFDPSGQPVVAIKGAYLSDFGGRSVSVMFNSTVAVNPDIPEALRLRAWFDQEGHTLNSQSLTKIHSVGGAASVNWKTLSDVKSEHMGQGEKAECFSCLATVLYVRKENCLYQACPADYCYKKVIEQRMGLYRCEKCNREFPSFKHCLLLHANIADFGDDQWVTCFQGTAEALLGHSVETLGRLRETALSQ